MARHISVVVVVVANIKKLFHFLSGKCYSSLRINSGRHQNYNYATIFHYYFSIKLQLHFVQVSLFSNLNGRFCENKKKRPERN